MIGLNLITAIMLAVQAAAPAQAQQPKTDAPAVQADPATNAATLDAKLRGVTRIYIDDFGSDPVAKQIQAMVVNSISESKRFIITENREKADAIMKGMALEKTSQEFHGLNDKAAAATSHSGLSSGVNGSINGVSGSTHAFSIGSAIAADDSSASTETINDARVAVRLVAADGDVIWSTTQESRGAKYKGASADIADKVVKQLILDLEKLQAPAVEASKTK
jgi:hypothetical protein